jgi:hypothetical protein
MRTVGKSGLKQVHPSPLSPSQLTMTATPPSAHCGEIGEEAGPSQPPLPLAAHNDRQPLPAHTVAKLGMKQVHPNPTPPVMSRLMGNFSGP